MTTTSATLLEEIVEDVGGQCYTDTIRAWCDLAQDEGTITPAQAEQIQEWLTDRCNYRMARIEAGYCYHADPEDDVPEGIGFHGDDSPPCDGEYLMQVRGDGYLVLCDDDRCECIEGWTATRTILNPGHSDSDGTWSFVVLCRLPDGRTLVAGWC
jgi:hypothetical protein